MRDSMHHTIAMNIGTEPVEVDEEAWALVALMNQFPGIVTSSSCQGDPGPIGQGGAYGHISFKAESVDKLFTFCAGVLASHFKNWIDDEVRISIFIQSEPWGSLDFRNEVIPNVEEVIGKLVASTAKLANHI